MLDSRPPGTNIYTIIHKVCEFRADNAALCVHRWIVLLPATLGVRMLVVAVVALTLLLYVVPGRDISEPPATEGVFQGSTWSGVSTAGAAGSSAMFTVPRR